MASIRYSATGGEIKGKINGTVYQGGKSGPIVKRLLHRSFVRIAALIYGVLASTYAPAGSKALDPASPPNFLFADGSHVANGKVADQRSLLADMSASWKTLTPEQRAAWNAAAVNFPFKNKFGDQYTGSGFQVYQQLNMNMVLTGQTANVFPPFPSIPVLPEITPPNGESDDPMLYTFPDGIPADQNILVYSSIGQSAGRQIKAKNQKLIGILPAGTAAGTVNLRYMWQLFFGMLQENAAVQFRFVPIGKTTGQAGAQFDATELIDAIAAGAKLTKADATIAFGNQPVLGSYDMTDIINLYNFQDFAIIDFSGADAAAFTSSVNGGLDFDAVSNAYTNQWNNLGPLGLVVRWQPTGVGVYAATLNVRDKFGVLKGTIAIQATAV